MQLLVMGEQIRAARALARIDQTELARRAELSIETIKRLERTHGRVDAQVRTLAALQRAFAEFGVELVSSGDGVIGVRRTLEQRTA